MSASQWERERPIWAGLEGRLRPSKAGPEPTTTNYARLSAALIS